MNLRTLVSKTSPFSRLRNAQLDPVKGFEPIFTDPKSAVLPIGRHRKKYALVEITKGAKVRNGLL